jgi:hypothetical protein
MHGRPTSSAGGRRAPACKPVGSVRPDPLAPRSRGGGLRGGPLLIRPDARTTTYAEVPGARLARSGMRRNMSSACTGIQCARLQRPSSTHLRGWTVTTRKPGGSSQLLSDGRHAGRSGDPSGRAADESPKARTATHAQLPPELSQPAQAHYETRPQRARISLTYRRICSTHPRSGVRHEHSAGRGLPRKKPARAEPARAGPVR